MPLTSAPADDDRWWWFGVTERRRPPPPLAGAAVAEGRCGGELRRCLVFVTKKDEFLTAVALAVDVVVVAVVWVAWALAATGPAVATTPSGKEEGEDIGGGKWVFIEWSFFFFCGVVLVLSD